MVAASRRREASHQTEERISHMARVTIERVVTGKLEEQTKKEIPTEPKERRKLAVWVRQAAFVALSVTQAQRTGVYQNVTTEEFGKATDTPYGIIVTHVGGKTKKAHKTCQLTVSKTFHRVLQWYLENLHSCLDKKGSNSKLFPFLNVWDPKMIDLNIEEIANIPYPRLLTGNHSRRHDVQMAHALDDEGKLEGTNVRELAALRCHSVSTATKSYDARNKVVRAARAAQALRKSANRAFGIADCQTDEEEEVEEVSTWGAN